MSKTIELIDKYRIEQVCGGDYDPPSYIWVDNTGEVIRCADCKHYDTWCNIPLCGLDIIDDPSPDDYCSRGERA